MKTIVFSRVNLDYSSCLLICRRCRLTYVCMYVRMYVSKDEAICSTKEEMTKHSKNAVLKLH